MRSKFLCTAALVSQTMITPLAAADAIRIAVLEGEGAINNIRAGRAKEPVVRVEEETGQPVRSAAVTFTLPAGGPGGTFTGGERTLIVMTDENGQAAARGFRPNQSAGPFEIRVSAAIGGRTAVARVRQVNAEPARAGGAGKKILIVSLIGAAAAGSAFAALSGSKSTPASATTVPGAVGLVITPGTPSFGPPQ